MIVSTICFIWGYIVGEEVEKASDTPQLTILCFLLICQFSHICYTFKHTHISWLFPMGTVLAASYRAVNAHIVMWKCSAEPSFLECWLRVRLLVGPTCPKHPISLPFLHMLYVRIMQLNEHRTSGNKKWLTAQEIWRIFLQAPWETNVNGGQ